ncbi:hypothetical protein CR513_39070, partial [Mucuna pruriens]
MDSLDTCKSTLSFGLCNVSSTFQHFMIASSQTFYRTTWKSLWTTSQCTLIHLMHSNPKLTDDTSSSLPPPIELTPFNSQSSLLTISIERRRRNYWMS